MKITQLSPAGTLEKIIKDFLEKEGYVKGSLKE
jgi:hypothetical protein